MPIFVGFSISKATFEIMMCCAAVGLVFLSAAPSLSAGPPTTERRPVSDDYHGTTVTEHYRWLEDFDDPEVQAWNAAQNEYARSVLDGLPDVEAIRERVTEILTAETVSYWSVTHRRGKFFAMKDEPPRQQPFLVVLPSLLNGKGEWPVVDPNEIDPEGGTSIDWYVPSPDGQLVAVSLSRHGTEAGDVHVFETATGRQLYEVVPRANTGTAGGDLAWSPDSKGFYYTRHPREGERPAEDLNFYQQTYYHTLGTPTAEDRYEIGQDFPRIAETQLRADERTGRVLATVQDGDGGEFAHYLRDTDGTWQQFSQFGDKIVQAEFGPNDDLFIVSRQDAPRGKILHLPIAALDDLAGARVVVPEGDDAIVTSFWGSSSVVPTKSRLYVIYQLGGPTEIRAFDHQGQSLAVPDQLPISTVSGLTPLEGDLLLFANGSYLENFAYYLLDPATSQSTPTALKSTSPVSFDDCEVVREFATSQDGTRVPVNIIMRKGTELRGTNPCVATGYGGYGISMSPVYSSMRRVMMDHGVVVAVANIRGGGEYGEQWHRQGNLTNKQNVFDDFAAVLEHLIERQYTSRERLAIMGGSNGGLLMGATLVQHPELVTAVVAYVGIYDMLRVELSPNGVFNVTEFGTVQNPNHFHALYAYSPYHNVEEGVRYPAVLFITGENDPRVEPMQSRKMTARLQAATASDAPILLRTSASSGHGGSTPLDEEIEQTVDVYAFLFDQLGLDFRGGKPGQNQGPR